MPGNADCAYATRTWRSGRDIGTRFFRREATGSYVARREIRVMRTAFLMEISTTESVLINVFANNSHVRFELSGAVRMMGRASSARAFNPETFLVGQRDNNAITNAINEFKRVLILAGNFVHVMPQMGNYVNRMVVASPVHCHAPSWYFLETHA
jgi:hypothetical protein